MAVQTGFDQILGAQHIRFDTFKRIIFGGRHLFKRGGMHDDFDPFKRTAQTRLVSHIADKVTDAGIFAVRKFTRHFELLQLVARENHQAVNFGKLLKHRFNESLTERPGPAGDKNGFFVEHGFLR